MRRESGKERTGPCCVKNVVKKALVESRLQRECLHGIAVR